MEGRTRKLSLRSFDKAWILSCVSNLRRAILVKPLKIWVSLVEIVGCLIIVAIRSG